MSNDLNSNSWSQALSKWITETFSADAEMGSGLDLQALEDRVLYSAGPIPVDVVEQFEISDSPDFGEAVEHQFEVLEDAIEEYHFSDLDQSVLTEAVGLSDFSQANELVIVDRSVEGYEALVEDLLSARTSDRSIEVVYLDENQDGIKQVSSILGGKSNLDSIHLVSHGDDGLLRLGNTVLDSQSLEFNSSEIASWQNALSDGADLLIYGCNVAESEVGEAFVNELSDLIDADISASSNITGHDSFGGDWVFEFQVGLVESDLVFSEAVQTNWLGSLVAVDTSSGDLLVEGAADSIAADFDGNIVQVFTSDEQPGANGLDVYVARFNPDGSQNGPVTKVNVGNDAGDQYNASVSMNDNGDYVVVWTTDDGGNETINAKVFEKSGATHDVIVGTQATGLGPIEAVGPVGSTESSTITTARNASVSINESGDFIVVWEGSGSADSDGVYGQRFGLDGVAIDSNAFLVNSQIFGYQGSADVAMNEAGDFIVGWDEATNAFASSDLYVVVYDTNLDSITPNNTNLGVPATYFTNASVDIDENRNFAVSTTSNPIRPLGFIGSSVVVSTSLYDSNNGYGTPVAAPAHSRATGFSQDRSSVVIADNQVVVTWEGEQTDGSDPEGIFMSVFSLDLQTEIQGETNLLGGSDGVLQTNVALTKFHDNREWALGYFDAVAGIENVIGNVEPLGQSNELIIDELETVTLQTLDFGYSNDTGGFYADNDPFTSITITSVTGSGQLLYNGSVVGPNTTISVEAIEANSLTYTAGLVAGVETAFEFTVSDGFESSTLAYSMDFNVQSSLSDNLVAFGDELVSLDGAQLVNDQILGQQSEYSVESLSNGNYVVTWQSESGGVEEILQTIYDANGDRILSNQSVGLSLNDRTSPDVFSINDGYVVVWEENNRVVGQRFDNFGNELALDGTAGASTFEIAQNNGGIEFGVTGVGLSGGGFVITWSTLSSPDDPDVGVAARVFNVNGQASDEFLVNQNTVGIQRDATVAALEGNSFIIGWNDLSVNDNDVKARVFTGGDFTSGTEITLNNHTMDAQVDVDFATLVDGRVVAVWESQGGQDGSGIGTYAVVLEADGTKAVVNGTTDEFLINQQTANHQEEAVVVATGDGGFVAIWESRMTDADRSAIVGLRYDSNFNAVGDEFIINSHRGGAQVSPEATVLTNGDVVVVWGEADGGDSSATYQEGVYVDRFAFGVTGNEDQAIPVLLDNLLSDENSEQLTEFFISGIPSGVRLTDGNSVSTFGTVQVDFILNSGTGEYETNGVVWDLSNLAVIPISNSHEDFTLGIAGRVSEGGTANSVVQTLAVKVVPVDDASQLDTPVVSSVSENSTVVIDAGSLTSGLRDPDSNFALTEIASQSFNSSSLSRFPVGGQFIWPNSDGSQQIVLDSDAVSFVSDSGSDIPILNNVYEFNGLGGGIIEAGILSDFGRAGGLELWVKPQDLTGKEVILDWSTQDQGVVLYQDGDRLILEIFDSAFPGSEPTILVAEGLSDTEFNQIYFDSNSASSPLGNSDEVDIRLYLNGQLADQVIDAPTISNNFSLRNSGDAGLGTFDGPSFADESLFTNFEGQVGQIEVFDNFEAGDEVEQRYLNAINLGEVVEIEGNVYAAGSTVSLASGALVNIQSNGDLLYDPNNAFNFLNSGESDTDTITYRVNNEAGESTEFDVTVTIFGVDPESPSDLSSGVELNTNGGNDAYLGTQDTSFFSDLDDFTIEFTYTSSNPNSATLFSYQTTDSPTGPGLFQDDFVIRYRQRRDYYCWKLRR